MKTTFLQIFLVACILFGTAQPKIVYR
jgi:hypothetical protein